MISSNPYIGDWVAKRINGVFHKEHSTCLGLLIDGQIKAGVIYENFNHASVVCHIACEFLGKKFLAVIFDYPFNVMKVKKIIAPVYSDNHKSRILVEKMGFSIESVLKDCAPNGDILLYTLNKSECKYLKEHYGKIIQPAARP